MTMDNPRSLPHTEGYIHEKSSPSSPSPTSITTSPSRWRTRGKNNYFLYQNHFALLQLAIKKGTRDRLTRLKKNIEFYFYYVCFSIVVPYMFYVTYNLSKGMFFSIFFIDIVKRKKCSILKINNNILTFYY